MMKRIAFLVLVIGCVFLPSLSNAQTVEMADQFRAEGKFFVVLAVIIVILIGIFSYLFMLDTKISKIEKRLKK